MKKILIAAVAILGATGAQAADIAARPYTKAPVAVPFTWTGSYIGGFVGGAGAAKDALTTDANIVAPTFGPGSFNGVLPTSYGLRESFIGGITSGYNWQFAPNWVLGYEGETGYINLRGSVIQNPPPGAGDTSAFTKVGDWYSLYTARFGYTWDRSMIYVKGGATVARVSTGIVDAVGTTLDTTSKKWKVGYAVGGGWEYAFDSKWSLKTEYMYLGLEHDFLHTGPFNGVGPTEFAITRVPGVHTGKIGLNYKWDWFSMLR